MARLKCPECNAAIPGTNDKIGYSSRPCPQCGTLNYPDFCYDLFVEYFMLFVSCMSLIAVIVCLTLSFSTIVKRVEYLSWEKVPAVVTQFAIDEENTVTLSYTYSYENNDYTGSRLTFEELSGDQQKVVVQEIKNIFAAKENTYCYVDPGNAGEAVLRCYFSLDDTMFYFIVIIIGGVFSCFSPYLLWSLKKKRETKENIKENPGEPWKWNTKIAGKIFKKEYENSSWRCVLATSIVLLVAGGSNLLFWKYYLDNFTLIFLILLIVMAFLVTLSSLFIELKNLESPYLKLNQNPIVTGSKISGTVVIPGDTKVYEKYNLFLSCMIGQGFKDLPIPLVKHDFKSLCLTNLKVAAWKSLEASIDKSGTTVDFELAVPTSLPETVCASGEKKVTWFLLLLYGKGLSQTSASFEVPVFDTGESYEIDEERVDEIVQTVKQERQAKGINFNKIMLRLITGCCCLMLLMQSFSIYKSYNRYKLQQNYKPVQAKVIDSTYDDRSNSDRTSYKINVTYEYRVDEMLYSSSVVGENAFVHSKEAVTAMMEKYAAGNEVPAFYNPEDPSTATLSVTTLDNVVHSITMFLMIAILQLIIWIMCFIMVKIHIRKMKKS